MLQTKLAYYLIFTALKKSAGNASNVVSKEKKFGKEEYDIKNNINKHKYMIMRKYLD